MRSAKQRQKIASLQFYCNGEVVTGKRWVGAWTHAIDKPETERRLSFPIYKTPGYIYYMLTF